MLGMWAFGGPKWPTPGPWNMGATLYRLVSLLSLVGMGVIFYIAIQPPNDMVLWIVVGWFVMALIVWFAVEKRRFRGPPIGDAIARRQAEILAAERAVGEI